MGWRLSARAVARSRAARVGVGETRDPRSRGGVVFWKSVECEIREGRKSNVLRGYSGFADGDSARRNRRVEVDRVGREKSHAERVGADRQDRSAGRGINLGAWNDRVVALVPPTGVAGINMAAEEGRAIGEGIHAIYVVEQWRHFVDREVLRDHRAIADGDDSVVACVCRRGGGGRVSRRPAALVAIGVARIECVAAPGKADGGKLLRGRRAILPVAEPAEAHHRAIGFEGDGVLGACVDGDDLRKTGGDTSDAVVVAIAPCDDRAVGLHRDRVHGSR